MLWVPLAIAGASAAYQYYQGQKASEEATRERRKLEEFLNKVQDPSFDESKLEPKDFQVLEKYSPESAQAVAEARPDIVKAEGAGAKAGREAQLNVLSRMQQMAMSGQDPIAEMQRQRALRDAMSQSNVQRQNIEESMQRRGMGLGSGMGLAAQMQANAAANQQAALSGEAAMADAAQRRMQAAGQASQLGGQLYSQDVDRERMNADIINQYNQRMAQNLRQNEMYNVGERNKAQQYNIGERQRVSEANIGQQNRAMQSNQDLRNKLAQDRYSNQLAKFGRQAQMGQMAREDIYGQAQQRNQAVQGLSNAGLAGYESYQSGLEKKDAAARDERRVKAMENYYGGGSN